MKSEERREQLLGCAAQLFAERGYHATTVEHIVTHAGVARGTFYGHFTDKRTIFEELLEHYMSEIRARIIRIDPTQGADHSLVQMRQNVLGAVSACLDHRDLTKILLSQAVGLDDDFDQKLLEFWDAVTNLMESSLVLGHELGLVRVGNTRLRAVAVIGALKELLYQVIMGGLEVDRDELVDDFLSMYLFGLFVLPE